MRQRTVVVETGLDERAGVAIGGSEADGDRHIRLDGQGRPIHLTRVARTRFVEPVKAPEMPRLPEIGDPWCALTVRMRLQRWLWVRGHDPRIKPRRNPGSCMPAVVRERWKDAAVGTFMRLPVTAVDSAAADETERLLAPYFNEDDWPIIMGLAAGVNDTDVAAAIGVSDKTARKRKQAMLENLAIDWNYAGSKPDAGDMQRVERLFHRKF